MERLHQFILFLLKCITGFWGKNGFRSFDLILGYETTTYGWIHCESDVISLMNNIPYGMQVDIGKDKFIHLFNSRGFKIKDIYISNITIESVYE